MKFKCPKCKEAGAIEDAKVPESGLYATCPGCKERFLIKKAAEFKFEPVPNISSEQYLEQNDKTAKEKNISSILSCSHCGTSNRVPLNKSTEKAKCGKCGYWLSDKKSDVVSSEREKLYSPSHQEKVSAATSTHWYGYLWPSIFDLASAENAIKYGFWVAVINAAISVLFGLLYPAKYMGDYSIFSFLLSGILWGTIAYLLHIKSRVGSILGIIFCSIEIIIRASSNEKPAIFILFLLYYISAARGSFAYYKLDVNRSRLDKKGQEKVKNNSTYERSESFKSASKKSLSMASKFKQKESNSTKFPDGLEVRCPYCSINNYVSFDKADVSKCYNCGYALTYKDNNSVMLSDEINEFDEFDLPDASWPATKYILWIIQILFICFGLYYYLGPFFKRL